MNLSILIPTLNEPHYIPLLKRLKNILDPQVDKFKDRVIVHYHDAGRSMTIGQKRNELINRVQTEYSVFVDSDDMVAKNYLSSIFWAIDQNPDVITFNGNYTCNGKDNQRFVIKLGERYEERNRVFYRWPNHLCPMRTNLVRHIKFPHIVKTEDFQWSKMINDRKLLKTSVHLDFDLYHYDFNDKKPAYGTRPPIR